MNDVLNSQGYTQAAWWNRIPPAAWFLMFMIAVLCNGMIGYAEGRRRRLFMPIILPIIVSISFYMIADIDSPRSGLVRVVPQNLLSLGGSRPESLAGPASSNRPRRRLSRRRPRTLNRWRRNRLRPCRYCSSAPRTRPQRVSRRRRASAIQEVMRQFFTGHHACAHSQARSKTARDPRPMPPPMGAGPYPGAISARRAAHAGGAARGVGRVGVPPTEHHHQHARPRRR